MQKGGNKMISTFGIKGDTVSRSYRFDDKSLFTQCNFDGVALGHDQRVLLPFQTGSVA